MHGNVTLSTGLLVGFLLVLARVAGVFALVPFPGFQSTPQLARAALVLGITLALYPRWPTLRDPALNPSTLFSAVLAEAVTGLAIGVSVSVFLEAFAVAAQAMGLQAGYAYASTIDPTTQADSGVLLVIAQLTAGLLFFCAGFDREVVRLLARSLEKVPPGEYVFSRATAEPLIRMAGAMFTVGLRLALPIIALLLMVDLALALLGRLNTHLQLLSLAFPAKMLAALAILMATIPLFPRIMNTFGAMVWQTIQSLLRV